METKEKKPQKKLIRRGGLQFVLQLSDIEPGGGGSETIQDDSYTIKDLLEKHTKGIDLGLGKVPQYAEDATHDDVDMEKFNNMDHNEKHEVAEQQRERMRELKLLQDQKKKNKADRLAKEQQDEERRRQKDEEKNIIKSESNKYDSKQNKAPAPADGQGEERKGNQVKGGGRNNDD